MNKDERGGLRELHERWLRFDSGASPGQVADSSTIVALLDRLDIVEEALEFYAAGNSDLEPKPEKAHLYDAAYHIGSEKWLQRSMSDYWSGAKARAALNPKPVGEESK